MKDIIITNEKGFRHDTDDFFKLSGIRENSKLSHHPFIVFDDTKWREDAKKEIERHQSQLDNPHVQDMTDLIAHHAKEKERLEKMLAENNIVVTIVDNAKDLLEYREDTLVIAQWAGKWRSDFFSFRVGDLKLYTIMNPKEGYHIV